MYLLFNYFLLNELLELIINIQRHKRNSSFIKDTFNKHYPTKTVAEERKHIFLENRRKIAEHNEKYERGEVTYKAGLNKFSDMLPDEIRQLMTGYRDYNAT